MLYRALRPLLLRLPAELAHDVAIRFLKIASLVRPVERGDASTALSLLGLKFRNRVGLAAGFDKSARHIDALGQLGFGFIEVGTVTPRPQPGHPPPNVFRLIEDGALINRMGFNNDGVEAVVQRLERRRYRGVCGVNIGKNADTPLEQASHDYVTCLRAVYATADYVTINVSSPNTAGLRELQDAASLERLLLELTECREKLSLLHRKHVPLLIKIAPDLDDASLDSICSVVRRSGIDGIVATNTTTARPYSLRSPHACESGGLSGRPLHPMSLAVVRGLRARLGADFPLIGVGGISSADAGRSMLAAGANLIQVYSGLIYEGPALVRDLVREVGGKRSIECEPAARAAIEGTP
jgi:dihydroorotate dehydrogenase